MNAPQLAAVPIADLCAAQVLANEAHRDRRRKRPAQMKPRYTQASAVEDGERWPHVTRPKAPYNRLNTPLRLFMCDSVKAMLEGTKP